MTINVYNDAETEAVGKDLAEKLVARGTQQAFIAMRGEMGVGKTVFTRGFASHFGIKGVKSPTYTIVNEYRNDEGVRIFHFDLYRISDVDDLISIGYDDYVRTKGYCIAEWSERAESELPRGAIFVTISRTADNENEIIIEISGLD